MGKLVESTFITLDGVISEPQRWSPPYWDEDHNAYASKLMADADALLLGRATYEGFSSAWPERSGDWYTDKINAMPKYVASRRLTEATWNAEILQGDVPSQVATLKEQGNLLKFGTGVLDSALMKDGLVDEFHFWVFPVIAGSGDHMLNGMLDTRHLKLRDVTRFGSGIVVLTYVAS